MSMRAAQLVGPGQVIVRDFKAPRISTDEILIKTEMAAICGSDLHAVFGGDVAPLTYPCPPGYPGHESVGIVIESKHPEFTIGDLVLSVPVAVESRGFAQIQEMNPGHVLRCPSEIDRAAIILAQQMGTVIFALKRFWNGPPGKTAAIFGTGPAGLHFTQLLKKKGFENVIAVDLSRARLRLASQLGADLTIPADKVPPVEAIMDFTSGRGADLVVEAAGRDLTRVQAMEAVAQGGRIGLYGLPEHSGYATFPYQTIFRRQAAIEVSVGAQREPGLSSFKTAIKLITNGTVQTRPFISHVIPLENINHAFELARTLDDDAVKVCVSFT
jgi:L-iditol 2-dehydrogenase